VVGVALLGAAGDGGGPDTSPLSVAVADARQEADAPALLRALAGTPPVACELVLHGLGNRWGDSSVRPRVHAPLAASPAEQALAEWAWTGRPGPEDAAALMDGLASGDRCTRSVAARLLGLLDDPATTARLVARAQNAPGQERLAAIAALGQVGGPEASDALEEMLGTGAAEVRLAAAWALGETERRESVGALVTALGETDPQLRENAAWALGRIESREAVAPLTRALQDSATGVRVNAAWALGAIEDASAIPALASLLTADPEVEVRHAAAWALGRIER
jgi:HEAT repeat protein